MPPGLIAAPQSFLHPEAMAANPSFIEASDFLLRHRDDYATAYRDFVWPKPDEFNLAIDHFDATARGQATISGFPARSAARRSPSNICRAC